MSYIVFLNGQRLDGYQNINLAQTKQVNDIASLTSRNSNYTLPMRFPRTANNVRIVEGVFNVGSQSNIPYQKCECNVIDADTGLHFIYKGYAVLTESTNKEYSFTIYDGIIDFYKAIENITITEIGVSDLNHIKNIANVINTWTDPTLPYRYILADYNGENLTALSETNIDFQVPSALCPYIWNRIFDFIGFNFYGSIFSHEKFLNLWLTYPKPVPTSEPVIEAVTEQDSTLVTETIQYTDGGGVFYGSATSVNFFPNGTGFDPAYYNTVTGIQQAGLYRLTFAAAVFTIQSPTVTSSKLWVLVYDQLNQVVSSSYINIANGNYIDLHLNIGDRVAVEVVYENANIPFNGQITPGGATYLTGSTTTSMVKIEGYTLGFDQAFIDYKVSDFVKEILIEFGLTPYKDKYTNDIKFLTVYELLQNQNIEDWSDKFVNKLSEKYNFGNYAKRNTFKYKYNDDGMSHNNGYIEINNENLPDEYTLHESKVYSPDRLRSSFLGGSNIYRIWEKQPKDDGTIEYKDLDGRFYFMRAEKITSPMILGSTLLGGDGDNPFYYRESYYRLSFTEVLDDWYRPMKSIFDKAKLVTNQFWLSKRDVYNFDFSKLIVIKQLSSYYIVNKISNFVKGKVTSVECIEVDYYKEAPIVAPPNPDDYTVEIGTPTIEDCEVTLPVSTDYPLPADCDLVVYAGSYDAFVNLVFYEYTILPVPTGVLAGGTISFPITQLPYNPIGYKFGIRIHTSNAFIVVNSNQSDAIILDGSCYAEPELTNLSITSVEFISTTGLTSVYRIVFASDVVLPVAIDYDSFIPATGFFGGWNGYTTILAETNSIDISVGVIFGAPTKFKLRIGTLESADFVL